MIDVDDEESWDDDVVPLFSPPAHLRRASNESHPINIPDDSDDEKSDAEDLHERVRKVDEPRGFYDRAGNYREGVNTGNEAPGPSQEAAIAQPILHSRKRMIVDLSTPPIAPNHKRKQARFAENVAGPSTAGPSTTTAPADDQLPPAQIFVARILDILPDICPEYVMREVLTAPGPADEGIANIISKALEEGYPKKAETMAKEKEKAVPEAGQEEMYKGKVYHASQRRGLEYRAKCIEGLEQAFPSIPVTQ